MRFSLMPRFLVQWLLPLGIAIASWRFLLGVEATMPFMLHHALERPLAFFAHVGLAPVALFVLPFQFWRGLRNRRPVLHRWLGRIYGVAILLSGVGGLILALRTDAGPIAASGFATLAVFWLGTTAYAVYLAMQRRIQEHRVWMIRSAALTLAAVTLRLYLPILASMFGFETGYPLVAWLCWVPNVLLAEYLIRRRRVAFA